MSELTGVPSLSTAHRQVLLRGRGRSKTIKDLHTVEEGVRKKKRKWGLISDTEDDSDNSSEEFVETVPKLANRSTPRRKAAVLTPRMKRMRVEEGASMKRRKREEGSAVSGESVCSKDQERRAFLQKQMGVREGTVQTQIKLLSGTEWMARAGLSTHPLLSFFPLKDLFCPFSIKG
jgi:hypothetical protein